MPIEWLLYPLLGMVAGLLAGLLGVGGGLVLVAALVLVLPGQGVPPSAAMHAALATSLASVIITSLASTRAHWKRGSVSWPSVAWLVPGLLPGAWLGSVLATRMSGGSLRWFVVAYCVVAALQLLFGLPRAHGDGRTAPRGPGLSAAGVGIGAVSSLVGIGGGSMTVPLLVWRGVQPVRAVGTSSACGVAIGLASAAGYALHAPSGALPAHAVGYIYLPAAIGVAVASVLAAPYGTRLAHRIGGKALKRVFAVFMVVMGMAIIASG